MRLLPDRKTGERLGLALVLVGVVGMVLSQPLLVRYYPIQPAIQRQGEGPGGSASVDRAVEHLNNGNYAKNVT